MTRKDLTDRLGVSATASDAEVLATLDERLKLAGEERQEDAIYQMAFGHARSA